MPRIIVGSKPPKRGPIIIPPATAATLAPLLVTVGAALSVAGWMDVLLFYLPPHLGDRGWEFGTVAETMDAMPLPTLGLALLALGLRAGAVRPIVARPLAVVLGLVALACLGLLVLFSVNIDVAYRALTRAAIAAQRSSGQPDPGLSRDLKVGIIKTIALCGTYFLTYGALAWLVWRRPRGPD